MKFRIVCFTACFIVVFFRYTESTCQFPDGLRGTWISSADGQLTFNDTYISGWTSQTYGNLEYECMSVSGSKYAVKSTSSVKYQQTLNIFVYICFVLTEVKAGYSFYYFLGSEPVAQSNNERVHVQFTSISVSNNDVCNRATYETGTYDFLMKEGSIDNAKQQCPDELVGKHNYTTSSGTQCTGDTILDVCTDKTALVFDNSNCSQIQAFSVNGSLNCVYHATIGSYVYVSLYNNDATTDESTNYRFTCYVVSTTLTNLSATQHPKHCSSGQTPWSVASPGFDIDLTTTDECEPVTSVPDSSGLTGGEIAGIVIGVLVAVVIVVLIVFLCFRFRKKLRKISRKKWSQFRTRFFTKKIQTEISTQTPHEKDTQTGIGSGGRWSWGAKSPSEKSGIRREKSIILHVGNNGRLMGFTPVDAPTTDRNETEKEKDRKSWYTVREKSEIVISKDGTLVDLKSDSPLPPGPLLVNDSSSDSEIRLLSEDDLDGEKKLSFVIVSQKNIEPIDKKGSRQKTRSKKLFKKGSIDEYDSSDSDGPTRITIAPIDKDEKSRNGQLRRKRKGAEEGERDSSDSDNDNEIVVVKGSKKLKKKKKKSFKAKDDKKVRKKSKKKSKNKEEENETKKKKKSLRPLKKSRPAPVTDIVPVESANGNIDNMLSANTTDIISNIENGVMTNAPDDVPPGPSVIQNDYPSHEPESKADNAIQRNVDGLNNTEGVTPENKQHDTNMIAPALQSSENPEHNEVSNNNMHVAAVGVSKQQSHNNNQVGTEAQISSPRGQKHDLSLSDDDDDFAPPPSVTKSVLSYGKPQDYLFPSNEQDIFKSTSDQGGSKVSSKKSKSKDKVSSKSPGSINTARSTNSNKQKGPKNTETISTTSRSREKSFDVVSYSKLKKQNTIADYESSVGDDTAPPSVVEGNKNSIYREKILSEKEREAKREKEESGRKKHLSVWQGSAKSRRK